LEIIQQIVSFSHNGVGSIWCPFYAKMTDSTIISMGDRYQIDESLALFNSMFSTNNHSPQILSTIETKKKLFQNRIIDSHPKTHCVIKFRTDKNEYVLERIFAGKYSTEATLRKTDSWIIFTGNDAIQMLSKFHKPKTLHSTNGNPKCTIFDPLDNYSRARMVELTNGWADMLGTSCPKITLNHRGVWSYESSNQGIDNSVRILTILAQIVMKKRTFGKSVPVVFGFAAGGISNFEAMAIVDLSHHICKNERLQVIIFTNTSTTINKTIHAIENPGLGYYRL
jgi:hypothetical protein